MRTRAGTCGRYDMVYGVPLVVGVKKGYPNFNQFAMHTQVQLSRKLQFVRQSGVPPSTAPIVQTNQMFLVGISNVMGVELWNSYTTTFTRPVQLYVFPDISLVLTNETGTLFDPPTQRYQPVVAQYATSNWLGYVPPLQDQSSFILPFSTNLMFLTNSVYRQASQQFVPADSLASSTFESASPAFYVPHWWLIVKARLRVAMVDTSVTPNRIVDYVNLSEQNLVDVTGSLTDGGQCGTSYNPDGSYGSFWCTNHYPNISDETVPTYGILNQIAVSMAQQPAYNSVVWNPPMNGFPASMGTKLYAIDFFRAQFGMGPVFTHPPNTVFYRSNTFVAPFQPLRTMYLLTSWQANDPLVHYTVSDLTNPVHTNFVLDQFSSITPDPVAGLGRVNDRYEPWGGNPDAGSSSPTLCDPTVKDSAVFGSDYWDFPTNQTPDAGWLARVHRGTPWQTIYLKAPAASFSTWLSWSGDDQLVANWNGINGVAYDAYFSQPTNDWRLASLLVSLFSTNAPRNLYSVNQPSIAAWCSLLDGMTVYTNTADGQLDSVLMQSNSPQALTIATALDSLRASQPRQCFQSVGDILAAPALSTASPWLDLSSAATVATSLTDEAYEAIPAQLLPLLRADSVGFVRQAGSTLQIQFTGFDLWPYLVQTSSNLRDWTTLSTNYPTNGVFTFSATLPPGAAPRFYRSVLGP